MDVIRILCAVGIALVTTYWGSSIMTKLSLLLSAVRAQTSVVASAVTFMTTQAAENARLNAQLREHLEAGNTDAALGTLDELETAQREVEANTAELAKAFAANTDSAAEVPAHEDGGIGTTDTVVDPALVEVDPSLTDGTASGGEQDGSQGSGAAAGGEQDGSAGSASGTSDGGAISGGTQTGAGDGGGEEGPISGGPGNEGTAEAADGAGQGDTGAAAGAGTDTGDTSGS